MGKIVLIIIGIAFICSSFHDNSKLPKIWLCHAELKNSTFDKRPGSEVCFMRTYVSCDSMKAAKAFNEWLSAFYYKPGSKIKTTDFKEVHTVVSRMPTNLD